MSSTPRIDKQEASPFESSMAREIFISNSHATQSLKKMRELYTSGLFVDIHLKVRNVLIPAHRLVLSAVSDYFQAKLTSEEAENAEMSMHSIDPEALKALVDFCYTGQVEIHETNVENLLALAHMLEISEVEEACSKFMISRLNSRNCMRVALFAESLGYMELHRIACKYTRDHFKDATESQEYLNLHSEEIKKLLSSDMIVCSEERAFTAMMVWMNYDLERRKKDLASILSLLELARLSPQFLNDNLVENPLFCNTDECYDLVIKAMEQLLLSEQNPSRDSYETTPQASTVESLLVIGGHNGQEYLKRMEKYDILDKTWSSYGEMTSRKSKFGAVVIENRLFIVGGYNKLPLDRVECFDIPTQRWTKMPSMSTPRFGLGVGVLNHSLYAVGGSCKDGNYLNSVERWDPETQLWSDVAALNIKRMYHKVAVLGNRLYAVGGYNGSALSSVECFDLCSNKWTQCCSMCTPRMTAGVAALNGYLYAVGRNHYDYTNSVEKYDPRMDRWCSVAPMKVARSEMAVTAIKDCLFAIGGFNNVCDPVSLVEMYEPRTKKWEELPSLNYTVSGACAVPINSSLAA